MRALHSSSALVCNFFDYWRNQDKSALADALGIKQRITRIAFEKKFPTGLHGTPPHLDVVLTLSNETLVAVESKFLESYYAGKNKNLLRASYLPDATELWSQKGLPHCQQLAKNLHHKHFKYLDAAQLLKHMLGLANDEHKRQWKLWYLWFNPGGSAGEEHQKEIEQFIDAVNGDGEKVRAITYQSVFNRLSKKLGDQHAGYKDYLAKRYFQNKKPQTN